MALVPEVPEHIFTDLPPPEIRKYEKSKHKFVRNHASDNLRVLNFMRNPYWHVFLLPFWCTSASVL